MSTNNQPQDRFKAVWLIFFVLGLGTLLPWNFFMTATQYFTSRLQSAENGSALERSGASTQEPPRVSSPSALAGAFNNFMTLCAMLPLLLFTCLNSLVHQRIPQRVRILGSLLAILLLFMITAALVRVPLQPLPFFVLTMVKIVLINSFGAILQGSLFGLAGLLPISYTAPIMSGQGLAGTFAALAMICAIASGSELSESAFGYFVTACVVIVLAVLCYVVLPKLEFFRYYQVQDKNEYRVGEGPTEQETKMDLIQKREESGHGDEKETVVSSTQTPLKSGSVISIFKSIWDLALSACFVFTVTIGIFPAVAADVKSSIAGSSTWGKYFIPVSCFLTFNIFDWAGRSLTAICMWPGKDSRWLPALVLARLIFVPAVMLCNVQPRQNLPVLFAHDAWFLLINALFAFSNGYLASLCMCFGPKKVNAMEAETAGAVMAFFLSLGLALGAIFSFLFRTIV
ncbi:equilibrative nucleoside transporter 1 [Ornithorhynchus anatinus]|uniref:Solute carrier family 29 member 1 (Augustine blood group) n=1 Tax=Ornithorhynchus anatinus TaxID=9258 RepID=F6W4L1_ORNAN|nr:equilibrative nucleoside transporter 1 [Ornithorhynchus anatinus]XP_028903545.1 equilibrative nucleoside transporter 1 [Ornithorhynchus anatinus]XP_028903546.1 equilibrative nucleoside transporter 1 [Ornithorhynchus anatinus]XP_039770781.1 equilibrative nucleoside transporter 1 [Ornithorhynchus anatinus]